MKYVTRFVVGLLTLGLIHVFALDGKAFALTQLTSPFGSAAVQVFIGQTTVSPGPQMVFWRRISDGACQSNAIGTASGLADDYDIVGGSGNDDMRILSSNGGSFCNFPIAALIYNGHYLDLHGAGGNDHMSSANGDTWLFGDDGNDRMFFAGFGNMYGGNGNDSLVADSSVFSSEGLFGEAGADCLEDASGAAATVDCGAGSDTVSTAFGPLFNAVNCETTTPNACPTS
jgi:hypothetical protein